MNKNAYSFLEKPLLPGVRERAAASQAAMLVEHALVEDGSGITAGLEEHV